MFFCYSRVRLIDWHYSYLSYLKINYRYHTCIDGIHVSLIKKISYKTATNVSIKEINEMICEGMNDVIVYCSGILENCMERHAMLEMQIEQWRILQATMTKKKPFEDFQCEQQLFLSSATDSVNESSTLIFWFFIAFFSVHGNLYN